MASPNHRIIVDPSILADAMARRSVMSEFCDDLFVQLHHRKALLRQPYPQMRSRTQVCLPSPYAVPFCMKHLGKIVHVAARWFGTESLQGVVEFEITFQHWVLLGEISKASSPQKDPHSYVQFRTHATRQAFRSSWRPLVSKAISGT